MQGTFKINISCPNGTEQPSEHSQTARYDFFFPCCLLHVDILLSLSSVRAKVLSCFLFSMSFSKTFFIYFLFFFLPLFFYQSTKTLGFGFGFWLPSRTMDIRRLTSLFVPFEFFVLLFLLGDFFLKTFSFHITLLLLLDLSRVPIILFYKILGTFPLETSLLLLNKVISFVISYLNSF